MGFVHTKFALALAAAVASAALAIGPASAAPMDFTFRFYNVLNDEGVGRVTGVIRGLDEGTGAATSVEVTGNDLGFGLGEYIGSPEQNSWTVTDGVLTSFFFAVIGAGNEVPYVTESSLFFDSRNIGGASFRAGLLDDAFSVDVSGSGLSTADFELTFSPVVGANPFPPAGPMPVPIPAAGLMLIAGLGGLALMRRRNA